MSIQTLTYLPLAKNYQLAIISDMEILVDIWPWIQVGLSIILVSLILLQKSDGSLGSAFGGGDASASFNKKRGLEKTLFNATIVLAIIWVLAAIVALFV